MRPGTGLGRAASLPLLAIALACAAGPAPRDHFYRLEAGSPAATLGTPRLPGVLEVERFRSDALTGERSLLFRADEGVPEVQRHAYHAWVDSPTLLLQRATAAYLSAAGVAERVVTPELRMRPDYVLSGRILKLERVLAPGPPRTVLEVELGLTQGDGGKLLLFETYREERPAAGDDVAASAAAAADALTAVLERFVADLPAPR